MATDDMPFQKLIPVWLECGCIIKFRCRPSVGDYLWCVFHEKAVYVIPTPKEKVAI